MARFRSECESLPSALAGKSSDLDIDAGFIEEVDATVEPDQSVRFLPVRTAATDKVRDALKGYDLILLYSSLQARGAAKRDETFAAEETEARA